APAAPVASGGESESAPEPASAPEGAETEESGGFRGWWRRRKAGTAQRWSRVGSDLSRTRLVVKVFLLHVRYVFGYLAFGFLVSAPLQIGRLHEDGWLKGIAACLVLGFACLIPFAVLYPFTRIAWERMRIPEFKNLELALTGWAAIAAAVFVLATGLVRWPLNLEGWPRDVFHPGIAWLCFGLMFFAWVRVKFHTLLFREFYTLRPDDDLVLRVPERRGKEGSPDDVPTPEASEELEPPSD
ncbi:MAG: hypothetical protein JKY65_18960, partial [Planctomycetes bacterium]|nr:hypothetical protein [Planctomycetota bacterium]